MMSLHKKAQNSSLLFLAWDKSWQTAANLREEQSCQISSQPDFGLFFEERRPNKKNKMPRYR